MNNPKVSIIIPCYNGEKYLSQAIESALNQTYKNIEIIVVNDGSVDGTEGVALSYGNRIRYVRKENGGVASALNLGIKMMTGEYFSWLSHDDLYYPEKVFEQIKAISNSNCERKGKFVYSNYDLLYEDSTHKKSISPVNRVYGKKVEESLFPVLFNLINGCTVLIHKSMFEEKGLFDEKLKTSQDYDMWYRLLKNYDPIYVDENLVTTRQHSKQGSKTIADFSNNCQDLQIQMVDNLTDKMVDSIFGGKYKLYSDMVYLSIINNWTRCVDVFLEKIQNLENKSIGSNNYGKVAIYGAGINGKRILKECKYKNIPVLAVVDRDSSLWGEILYGVECMPIDKVSKDTEIWIAVANDKEIRKQLLALGYTVKGYEETNAAIFLESYSINAINELLSNL